VFHLSSARRSPRFHNWLSSAGVFVVRWAISASFLPATMPNLAVPGLVTIYVELSPSAWVPSIIMTAPAANSIAVAPTSLQFAYTVGGTVSGSAVHSDHQ